MAKAEASVEFDELRHGLTQSLWTGEHQQIEPSLEGLVEPLQLAVGLGMVRRAVDMPDLERPRVILQHPS
jgi:hypothetical protein